MRTACTSRAYSYIGDMMLKSFWESPFAMRELTAAKEDGFGLDAFVEIEKRVV